LKNPRIAVLGAGGWGTAIASVIGSKGILIKLWAREEEVAEDINRNKSNSVFLPGVLLPNEIVASNDLEEIVANADILIIAIPSYAVAEVARQVARWAREEVVIASATKGFDPVSQMRISEVLCEAIPQARNRIAVLSGPNHAEEIGRRIPSASVIASANKEISEELQNILMTDFFRVYTNRDVLGVEIGGALKNIIALDAGASDGLGFGDNTRAALVTRGLAEMTRLGVAMGANAKTFSGLSGIGDLLATCTSKHSRNRRVGYEIAQGRTLDEIVASTKTVAEGVHTVKAAVKLAKIYGIDMPLCFTTYQVLFEKANVREAMVQLMLRGAKEEA
jgi:glycerol-3-phosphate dehydrogenase (NAD(P)+)